MPHAVKILWTGGWDSTYRMIELSRMDVIIQPIYIIDEERSSEELELSAMETINQLLCQRPETKAQIMPVVYINKEDIPADDEITKAYSIIQQKTHLGIQHEWLARYAKHNPGLEIGTEAGVPSTSHIIDAIQTFGVLIRQNNTYILDKNKSSREGLLVLGNLEFPIIDKSEKQMLENVRNWGYLDVMSKIWFCHTPINGTPCGLCHPCAVKMESDMVFLLPQEAQKRYNVQKKLIRILGSKYGETMSRILYCRLQ